MDLREIASAYQSIYLNEEVEEELILEDLSQEEIDSLVEEIYDEFLEEGFSLEEIDRGFENYISEESEVLNEERAAKKARKNAKSYDEVKAEIDAREAEKKKQTERKASRKQKVEDSKKAAKVLKPSEKLSSASKKAVEKRKDTTGTTSGAGAQGTVRSKGGSVGAEGEKGTALPPGKKGGAMIKRDTKSVSGMEAGPKAKVKSGVRKAMTYRGVGGGKKVEIAGAGRKKMSDVVKSAEKKAKASTPAEKPKASTPAEKPATPENKVKSAAKGAVEKAKASVKSGVKKARNFVGSALGKLADKVKTEGTELDSFDTVIAYLIDEEIASDFTEATAMMAKLSEGTIAKIHSSQLQLLDEAVYGGGKKEEKKDTRMLITNADKKANTPAYQNYMKGDKRYKAADHMKGDK